MIFAITGAFIALDFATGIVKGLSQNSFKSAVMRQGLFHKTGELLCTILGALVDYAQGFVDLGVHIPVATAICVYIILMEISSAIENIGIISPQLVPAKVRGVLGLKERDDK